MRVTGKEWWENISGNCIKVYTSSVWAWTTALTHEFRWSGSGPTHQTFGVYQHFLFSYTNKILSMIKDDLTCRGNVHFPVSFLGCKLFCTGSPWLRELCPKIHRPALREVHHLLKMNIWKWFNLLSWMVVSSTTQKESHWSCLITCLNRVNSVVKWDNQVQT